MPSRLGRIGAPVHGRSGMIKSIQRGTTTSTSAVITAVETDRAVAVLLGYKISASAGGTCGDGSSYAHLQAANSVAFVSATGSAPTKGWQVVERH